MVGLVKVTDAESGLLKRFENHHGTTMAKVSRGKLVLTKPGKEAGYVVKKRSLAS
jgi:hypothetical protein